MVFSTAADGQHVADATMVYHHQMMMMAEQQHQQQGGGGVDDMTFSDREDVLSMDDDDEFSDADEDFSSSGGSDDGSSCSDDSSDWSSDDDDDDDELMEEMLAETMKFLPRTASSPAVLNYRNVPPPLIDQEALRKKSLMRADSVSNMLQPMNAAPASLLERIRKAEFVVGDSTLDINNVPKAKSLSPPPPLPPAPLVVSGSTTTATTTLHTPPTISPSIVNVIPTTAEQQEEGTQTPSSPTKQVDSSLKVGVSSEVPTPNATPASPNNKTNPKKHRTTKNPQDYYLSLLRQNEKSKRARPVPFTALLRSFFLEMSDEHVSGYDMPKAAALRTEDLAGFRRMIAQGQNLQVCNRFGESIVHAICRRGSDKLLQFFLDEANVSLKVVDDYGRNVMHDACWTAQPHFDLVERVLRNCPDLLLIEDKRGNTPLHYVRKEHWGLWCQFLDDHVDLLPPRDIVLDN